MISCHLYACENVFQKKKNYFEDSYCLLKNNALFYSNLLCLFLMKITVQKCMFKYLVSKYGYILERINALTFFRLLKCILKLKDVLTPASFQEYILLTENFKE